ncbi:MAG: DUF6868 family protein [Pseudomonadota bacterium]
MTLDQMTQWFGWMLAINLIMYAAACAVVIGAPGWLERIHGRMFEMESADLRRLYIGYLATYKILLIVFSFTPWLALQLMG